MLSKCVLKSYLILPFSGKIPIFSHFFLLFDENSYFFLLFWPVLLLDALAPFALLHIKHRVSTGGSICGLLVVVIILDLFSGRDLG